jgi:hypothetical protein
MAAETKSDGMFSYCYRKILNRATTIGTGRVIAFVNRRFGGRLKSAIPGTPKLRLLHAVNVLADTQNTAVLVIRERRASA